MKRIIMVSNELAPYKVNGGLGVAVERLVNQFAVTGNLVTTIFPTNDSNFLNSANNSFLKSFVVDNINYELSDFEIADYFSKISQIAFSEAIKLQNFKESIFIAHDNEMALTILLIKKNNPEVKTIFWLHSLYDYPDKSFFTDEYQKLLAYQSLMASAISACDLVVVSSGVVNDAEKTIWPIRLRDVQSSLIKAKKDGRVVIVESLGCLPKKIDLEGNSLVVRKTKDYFLFPSRPSFFKGIGFFGELSKRYKDVYDFLAVGSISKDIIQLYPEIKEIDWLSQEELFRCMKNAKGVILPSITEGYGLSAAESAVLSATTIYHDIGGHSVLDSLPNAFPVNINNKYKQGLYSFWGKLLDNRKMPQNVWAEFKPHFVELFDYWEEIIQTIFPLNAVNGESCNFIKKYETWGEIVIKEVEKRGW